MSPAAAVVPSRAAQRPTYRGRFGRRPATADGAPTSIRRRHPERIVAIGIEYDHAQLVCRCGLGEGAIERYRVRLGKRRNELQRLLEANNHPVAIVPGFVGSIDPPVQFL